MTNCELTSMLGWLVAWSTRVSDTVLAMMFLQIRSTWCEKVLIQVLGMKFSIDVHLVELPPLNRHLLHDVLAVEDRLEVQPGLLAA